MEAGMILRKAVFDDLDRITKILEVAVKTMHDQGNFQWDECYPSLEVYRGDIENDDLFVVDIIGEIVGAVVLNGLLSDEYDDLKWTTSSNALSIHRMVVDTRYQGQGIARAMLDFAESYGRQQNFKSIWADTNEQNKQMCYLFKLFGYHPVGIVYFRGKESDFLCFEKSL